MRVLHVIHSIDPRSGGPSHAIRGMVRAQASAGHAVALLATTVQSAEPWQPAEAFLETMRSDAAFLGVDVHLAPAYGRRPPWSRYAYSPASRLWLAGRIADRETGPEILHIHGVFSHVTTAAASIARRHDVPYVLRPAGTFDEACYRSNRWWLKEAFASLFTKRDLRKAASVHATSDAEAQTLRRLVPGDRVAVIPHGVELPPLERVQAAQPLYEAFPNLRGQRIVLFMSRLAPKKRPELVVQSMAILRRAGWDLKLLIAGHDAGQEATTRAAVRRCGLDDSVLFVGFLQGDLKRAALAAAEVFVLPSLDENYGVAVVEALAHGTPAVVTPEVAAHTYVDRSGSGRTVDGTASAIASGIAAVISNDARTLGTRGRDFVEQNLSWPAVNRHLEWLYERLLRAPVAVSQKRTTEN